MGRSVHFSEGTKGFSDDRMLELGLVSKSRKDGRYYDKFREQGDLPYIDTREERSSVSEAA